MHPVTEPSVYSQFFSLSQDGRHLLPCAEARDLLLPQGRLARWEQLGLPDSTHGGQSGAPAWALSPFPSSLDPQAPGHLFSICLLSPCALQSGCGDNR